MRFFCFFFFLIHMFNVFPQVRNDTDSVGYKPGLYQTNLSLITGFNYWRYALIELGVASHTFGLTGFHAYQRLRYFSTEIWINEHPVVGFKIGAGAAGGCATMAMSINAIYYTDFTEGTLRLRPEIGMWFGFMHMTVVYGYNLALTNKGFKRINRHNVSFIIPWKIKKIKVTYMQDPPPVF